MKFKVTMKDPDTLGEAIADAVSDDMKSLRLSDEEGASLAEIRCDAVGRITSRWFKWGEYLTVEIDTEAQTCVICEAQD